MGACLLDAWQEEGFHAGKACLRSHAGHVPKEGRARLPVTVIQEGDHGWQQKVVAQPAWHQLQVQSLMQVTSPRQQLKTTPDRNQLQSKCRSFR